MLFAQYNLSRLIDRIDRAGYLERRAGTATRSILTNSGSSLLGQALRRRVGRQGNPRVRDVSHTARVGAGKVGSAKLPMATLTSPRNPHSPKTQWTRTSDKNERSCAPRGAQAVLAGISAVNIATSQRGVNCSRASGLSGKRVRYLLPMVNRFEV
jgi:DNA-binding MarR family transcriptional regulator